MAVFGARGGCEGICVAILRRGEDTRAFVWQFEGEPVGRIANPISSVQSVVHSEELRFLYFPV